MPALKGHFPLVTFLWWQASCVPWELIDSLPPGVRMSALIIVLPSPAKDSKGKQLSKAERA